MNINMKLSLDGNIGTLLKKLAGQMHVILVFFFCGVLAYTLYFAVNLFYAKDDLDTLANKQATSERSKQIRFNEKTLQSLDQLVPANSEPEVPTGDRQNPFEPSAQ